MSPEDYAAFAANYTKLAARAERIFKRMMERSGMIRFDLEGIEFNEHGCEIKSRQSRHCSQCMERETDYISMEELLEEPDA